MSDGKNIIGVIYENDPGSNDGLAIELTEAFLSRPVRDQEAALYRLKGEAFAAHGDAIIAVLDEADEEIAALKRAVSALAA